MLITDCEDALKNAFRSYYPEVEQLRCWNHFLKNMKAAAKRYYLNTEETIPPEEQQPELQKRKREIISELLDKVTNLFRASSELEFTNEYNNISQTWPPRFRDWFDVHIIQGGKSETHFTPK